MASSIGVAVAGKWLLDNLSLTLVPGELVIVLGPNGAGKSTLLGCLSGARQPTVGQVMLDGRSLAEFMPRAVACRRSVVAQNNSSVMPIHAEEVVELGRFPHSDRLAYRRQIVSEAMVMSDIGDFVGRTLPTLSGGEQQRTHFARALAQIWPNGEGTARYLLLDEPTASLDLEHQAELMGMARALAHAGHGVLAILHDLNLAACTADRVLLLNAGKLAAEGKPADVLTARCIETVFRIRVDVLPRPDKAGPLIVPRVPELSQFNPSMTNDA
ncbi:MAG: heme ABC transporter ATP-binding protein [Pseudomonadota bacterium]